MATTVRFCLSYDPKMGIYRLQNDYYFNKKRTVDTDVVNDVTTTVRAKVLLHVWSDGTIFMT